MAMNTNPYVHPIQWRILLAGIVVVFVAFNGIFLVIRMSPDSRVTFLAPTILAIVCAFAVSYRLTTKNQLLVACLLSLVVPAGYIASARLILPDARDGWGALAYFFGTLYVVLAGTIGIFLGLVVNRVQRHDA